MFGGYAEASTNIRCHCRCALYAVMRDVVAWHPSPPFTQTLFFVCLTDTQVTVLLLVWVSLWCQLSSPDCTPALLTVLSITFYSAVCCKPSARRATTQRGWFVRWEVFVQFILVHTALSTTPAIPLRLLPTHRDLDSVGQWSLVSAGSVVEQIRCCCCECYTTFTVYRGES